jgi:hypothetical protein
MPHTTLEHAAVTSSSRRANSVVLHVVTFGAISDLRIATYV